MRNNALNPFLLILFIVIGAMLGNVIAIILGSSIPLLSEGSSVGLETTTLDLMVFSLDFGFKISLNLASIIGIFLSIIFYKKFI
ncbi:DUF4321 domain-containing protein [Proteinivorax hydrogeniformans]|uniref:DUF4321 domain-containing protein n=1 Tax=Proteinivorax hydrogeniformans TaxID=1826727 RepID=A0AAU8HWE5_9FIRM